MSLLTTWQLTANFVVPEFETKADSCVRVRLLHTCPYYRLSCTQMRCPWLHCWLTCNASPTYEILIYAARIAMHSTHINLGVCISR